MTISIALLLSSTAIWVYSLIVYPVLMAAVGWMWKYRGKFDKEDLPTLSLIIPCHNEEAVIKEKLENVATIEYPTEKLEVILVSDGSEDRTIELATKHSLPGMRIFDYRERRGKTSIVNDAVSLSSGEVLCLCDANVMFRPSALRIMVNRLQDSRIGAVTGDVRLASQYSDFGAGESLYYRFERALQIGESVLGSTIGVDGGMYVIRRELYCPPNPATILDDFVISMRVILADRKVVYEPSAIADENATPSSAIEYRRRIRVTAGAMQTLRWAIWPSLLHRPVEFWQWCSHKFLRWLSPLWLISIFVCSFLSAWSYSWAAALLAVELLFLTIALLAHMVPTLRSLKLFGVCYYFALSNLAMLVGLYKGIRGTQPVTWRRTQRSLPANSP